MPLILYIIFCLVLSSGTVAISASDNSNDKIVAEFRETTDLKDLPLYEISQEPKASWVLMDVSPTLGSGSYPAVWLDDKNHQASTAGTDAVHIFGTYHIVDVLTKSTIKRDGQYSWVASLFSTVGYDRVYSHLWLFNSYPLQSGVVVICRVNTMISGASEFDPAYALPKEWSKFVVPAIQYVNQHNQDFDIKTQYRLSCVKMLNDNNPLIAICAYRMLAKSGLLTSDLISSTITGSVGLKRSIMTALSIQYSPLQKKSVQYAISSVILSTQNIEDLLSITIGLDVIETAGASDRSIGQQQFDLIHNLFMQVTIKSKALHSDGTANQAIDTMLNQAGVSTGT